MSEEHQRGSKKGLFCAVAPDGAKCECGNDYRENGKPPWGEVRVPFRSSQGNLAFKTFEAHHVLSVAPVTAIVLGAASIDAIVRNTKWCINGKDNMVSMPMMAHTVEWYEFQKSSVPPPFANLPQHDWGHGAYLTEVKEKLSAMVKAVEDKSEGHQVTSKNIQADMEQLSSHFQGELRRRGGQREDGTHAAYNQRKCAPFSMASDDRIQERPFPPGGLSDRIEAWKKRILGAR
jgi:hypothetical protein